MAATETTASTTAQDGEGIASGVKDAPGQAGCGPAGAADVVMAWTELVVGQLEQGFWIPQSIPQ